jgi:hypothetical protein
MLRGVKVRSFGDMSLDVWNSKQISWQTEMDSKFKQVWFPVVESCGRQRLVAARVRRS